jgi:hypothetical protein
MQTIAPIMLGLGLSVLATLDVRADDSAVADNPYASH